MREACNMLDAKSYDCEYQEIPSLLDRDHHNSFWENRVISLIKQYASLIKRVLVAVDRGVNIPFLPSIRCRLVRLLYSRPHPSS